MPKNSVRDTYEHGDPDRWIDENYEVFPSVIEADYYRILESGPEVNTEGLEKEIGLRMQQLGALKKVLEQDPDYVDERFLESLEFIEKNDESGRFQAGYESLNS